MRAVAELLLQRGHSVTGSDRFLDQGGHSAAIDALIKMGLHVFAQDGTAISDTSTLVHSTAIEDTNPELQKARQLGCSILHRADVLEREATSRRLLAIAGTSGKTTVTGMAAWCLTQADRDPTVVNGDALIGRDHNATGQVRIGQSDLMIAEVDESDRSFLKFHPDMAVINNISKDHFDLETTIELFRQFAAQIRTTIVAPAPVHTMLKPGAEHLNLTWLIPPEVKLEDGHYTFTLQKQTCLLALPGRHNAENAAAAATLCLQAGLSPETICNALKTFPGIRRRLELVGQTGTTDVYDDYAHNPAKISATLDALKERYRRILCVWRPHGFGPLYSMHRELPAVFRQLCKQDRLFILPVFYAGGTTDRKMTTPDFVSMLKEQNIPADFCESYKALFELLPKAENGDALLFMGARDPELPIQARRFVQKIG